MGRALSLSLAGHLTLILLTLLLSATRQPLRIAEVVRPVRLVAYVETPRPAPRARAPRPVEAPVPARVAPIAPPAPAPASAQASASEPSVPVPVPVPVAVPKIVLPTPPPATTRTAPAPPRSAPVADAGDAGSAGASLRERLSRRLAAAAPAEPRSTDASAPQIASLAPPEPVPGPERPAPPAAGPATGAVLPIGDFPHAWYLTLLKEAVFSRWSPPSEFYTGGRAPVALVSFRIDRAGRIERVALKEGSGAARFDRSALAAVQSLGQAPALPETYREESLDVVIRFQNVK